MGNKYRYLCQVDTKRLIWLIVTVFAVVLVVQYLELPYGNVLSSLFSVGKVPVVGKSDFQTGDSSSKSQMVDTLLNGLNYTDTYTIHDIDGNTETSRGKDRRPSNDSASDTNRGPTKSVDFEEDSDPENESSSKDFVELSEDSTMENVKKSDNGSASEKTREPERSFSPKNVTKDYNSSLGNIQEEDKALPSEKSGSPNTGFALLSPALPPVISSPNMTSPTNLDTNSGTPVISVDLNTSSVDKDAVHTLDKNEKSKPLQSENSSVISVPPAPVKKRSEMPSNDSASDKNRGPNKSSGLEEDRKPENESSSKNFVELNRNSTMENVKKSDNGSAPEKAREPEHSFSLKNVTKDYNSSLGNIQEEDKALPSENSGSQNTGFSHLSPALAPVILSPITSPTKFDTNSGAPVTSVNLNTSSEDKDAMHTLDKNEKPKPLQSDNSSVTSVPPLKKRSEMPMSAVISISEMNDWLLQSRASYRSMKPRWSSAVDQELLYAKSQIENAPIIKNDPILYAPLFRDVSMFKRSYELMEQTLKVYIYREGGKPIFHQPVLKGIYASEGWFLKLLEANKKFVTKKPKKAHLFYLPFSSRMLEETLYVPNSHSHKNLVQYLKNYLDLIVAKYPFWNRTGGADHFLVACHDWAPSETSQLMARCIRALCNSDIREGFEFGKDVSLPETYVRSAQNPLRDVGGKPPSQRSILAFFAGNMHGYLRPILLQYWENKDPDMKIFGRMPRVKGKMNYIQHMKSSKYCICAKGYEVNSPRVVEAIFYECVPVIISDNFVPPFFGVLNWESFAVFVLEKDIPNLKKILLSIPEKRYLEMQRRVKKVQQHFLWHAKPVKYDIFHMILHSIWYNRVFQIRPR